MKLRPGIAGGRQEISEVPSTRGMLDALEGNHNTAERRRHHHQQQYQHQQLYHHQQQHLKRNKKQHFYCVHKINHVLYVVCWMKSANLTEPETNMIHSL